MQITVKAIKVLKKGTNDYGEWKLVQVTTIEDVKYTTLAKEAETINPGSIINIKDMDKDDKGRESFKKFEVEEKGQSPAQASPGTNGESQDRQRSIENQNRAGHITNLWIAGKISDEDTLVSKLRTWLEKLSVVVTTKPQTEKVPSTGAPPLANMGELYARAAKFGLSPGDVCEAVGIVKGENIIDWDEAWITTAKKFAATIKASQAVLS